MSAQHFETKILWLTRDRCQDTGEEEYELFAERPTYQDFSERDRRGFFYGRSMYTFCQKAFEKQFPGMKLERGQRVPVKIEMRFLDQPESLASKDADDDRHRATEPPTEDMARRGTHV